MLSGLINIIKALLTVLSMVDACFKPLFLSVLFFFKIT